MNENEENITIFELIDPKMIIKNLVVYSVILFGLIKSDPVRRFSIENDGRIKYSDYSVLWKNDNPGIGIQDANSAEKIARAFLSKKNKEIKTYRKQKNISKENLPDIFPKENQLEIIQTTPMIGLDKNYVDHWIVYFSSKLSIPKNSITNKMNAHIMGTSIKIKISISGKIIGLNSSWMPYIKKHQEVLIVPNKADNHSEKHDHSTKNIILFYGKQLQKFQQRFLVPYFMDIESWYNSHHHGDNPSIMPATKFSLIVNLKKEFSMNKIRLIADIVPKDNTSNYSYYWTIWKLTDGIQSEVIEDSGTEYTVTDGVFEVNLIVEKTDKNIPIIASVNEVVYTQRFDENALKVV